MFTIWVTTACNLRCKYCYEGNQKKNEFMTEQVAIKTAEWIVSWMKEHEKKCSQIRFHGGEPLLNIPAIKCIVDRLNKEKNLQFDYQITSNGYNIQPSEIEFLATYMNDISISIDGGKEINDTNRINIRGEGTFEKVIYNAQNIKKKFPKLTIRMTVTASTCRYLSENVLFLLGEGFDNIIVSPDICGEEWTVENVDSLEVQCNLINKTVSDMGIVCDVILPINKEIKRSICTGGIDGFNIDVKGDLFPCIYSVGDIDNYIGDIYKGIDIDSQLRIQKNNSNKIDVCEGCGGYDSCPTIRCKLINKKIMGDYKAPIPLLCELHRRSMMLRFTEEI